MVASDDDGEEGRLLSFGVVVVKLAQSSILGRASHRLQVGHVAHGLLGDIQGVSEALQRT